MLHYTRMTRVSWLYLISEFGPLVAFFVAGQVTDFFTAVAILMATTVVAVCISWFGARHIPWLPILSAVMVLAGGALTLIYQAPDAIIFADTMYYGTIALGLIVTLWRGTLIFKHLFAAVFAITDAGWRVLTWRWLIFLIIAATANEFARASLPPEVWIDYRFYKSIVLTFFALAQFQVARKYRIPEESNTWGLRQN